MDLGVGVAAGVVALPVGALATGFAVAVPAEGSLPRPSLSLLTAHLRTPVTFAGAAVAALVSTILGSEAYSGEEFLSGHRRVEMKDGPFTSRIGSPHSNLKETDRRRVSYHWLLPGSDN